MKTQYYVAGMCALWVLLFAPPVFSQQNADALPPAEDAEATAPQEPEIPASQEVEINEDNYRQFMELKDANIQRDAIPENVFKPGSGLQKLEKLPEESQKHLRNELREIIVQGDPWQPGDENTEYPYTPSEAASTNPALEKQEREAWGELVGSYHEREAQIYANSSGTRAARASEQGSSGGPDNNAGATGDTGLNQNGEGSQDQQAGQQGKPAPSDSEGTYSLNGSNDPNATSTAGVSQNAMEFLQGLGTGSQAQTGQQDSTSQDSTAASGSPGAAREESASSTAGTSQNAMEFLQGNSARGETAGEDSTASAQARQGQGETQADQQALAQVEGQQNGQDTAQADGQAEAPGDEQAGDQDDGQAQDGQQAETAQTPASSVPPVSPAPVASTEPEEESTAGASQNALEYLTREREQAPGSTGEDPNTVQPEGTLTIQDLLNAQGIGSSSGTNPVTSGPGVEPQPDEDKPDKDGGGR